MSEQEQAAKSVASVVFIVLLVMAFAAAFLLVAVPRGIEQVQGPNPDGSWGTPPEPMVEIAGVTVNTGTNEITLGLKINMGSEVYTANVTLQAYKLTKTEW